MNLGGVGSRIHGLTGMRDLDTQSWERNEFALRELRECMGSQGYAPIDTPILEDTELFVRKSGGELAGRLYNFTDPGGRSVSLRPEFTSSVIRYFIENEASLSLPIRWQYSGPVFRYRRASGGGFHQFTQSGAELVGAWGDDADLEIISLAARGLRRVGLDEFVLRIGDLGALHSLLDGFGLSESAKLFIIGNMPALRSGDADIGSLMEHASEVGMLRGSGDVELDTALENMSAESAEEFVFGLLKESMPSPLGRRTTDDIIARLLRKVRSANLPQSFERALIFADRLSGLSGDAGDTLSEARVAAADCGVSATPLDRLATLLKRVPEVGVDESQVTLDLGMARGISYYTGIIFEIARCDEADVALGGGGRYDGLVQALGGSGMVPAMGFAYNVDALMDALEGKDRVADGVRSNGG